MGVGYSGILWLSAVRICARVFVLPSHILSGPFFNQQIEFWFNQYFDTSGVTQSQEWLGFEGTFGNI